MSQATSTIVDRIVTRTSSKAQVEAEDSNTQLVRLCDGITALSDKCDHLYDDCANTIEAENALEPQNRRLHQQIDRLTTKLARILDDTDAPAISLQAAAAVAKTALALAPKDASGDLRPESDSEWLGFVVAEWLTAQTEMTTTLH
jgi:hypothetical protein